MVTVVQVVRTHGDCKHLHLKVVIIKFYSVTNYSGKNDKEDEF